MDPARFRRKVLTDLVASPWTLIPGAGGLSLLMIAWGLDQGTGWLPFLGVASLLVSAGTLATRWLFQHDDIAREAFEDLQREAVGMQEKQLDQLEARLAADRDPRDENSLRYLRDLYGAFRADTAWTERLEGRSVLEINGQVENLFRACIASFQRSLELRDTAMAMRTKEGQRSVFEAREKLLEEINQSIRQLAGTLDNVKALALAQTPAHDLARLRQELTASLDVAKKVEERMQTLEAELGHPQTAAPREAE